MSLRVSAQPWILVAALTTAACSVTSSASALTVHGDFDGIDVMFLGVTEDSATDPGPLYETPVMAGNALQFGPSGFGAFSQDGTADSTIGSLSFTLMAKEGGGIHSLSIAEAGDYTLAGPGTAATLATVEGMMLLSILEVDGVVIAPINAMTNVVFSPSDGSYDLINDPGSGVIFTGSAMIDVDALLLDNGVQGTATKLFVTLNNELTAMSEQGTVALIKKKSVGTGLVVTPAAGVPEPSSLALAGLGLLAAIGCLWRRRRV